MSAPAPDEVTLGQLEHDRMARNRIGRPLLLKGTLTGSDEVLGGSAFVLPRLRLAVDQARRVLADAKRRVPQAPDKAALRKARKAVSAASAALAKAEAAVVAEERGEAAAPAVRRDQIAQGAVLLREPQVQVVGKRAELTPALERLFHRDTLTRAEYLAGRRYRDAYEAAGLDLYPIGLGGEGGRAPPQSGNRRIEQSVASSTELQAGRACIGQMGTALLEHIVVDGLTIAAFAEKKAESEHVVKGFLKMVLIRLSEFWEAYDAAA